MEETGCEIICGAPATFAVKGIDDDNADDIDGLAREVEEFAKLVESLGLSLIHI